MREPQGAVGDTWALGTQVKHRRALFYSAWAGKSKRLGLECNEIVQLLFVLTFDCKCKMGEKKGRNDWNDDEMMKFSESMKNKNKW